MRRGVKAIPRKSAEIVLDLDATDNPLSKISGSTGSSAADSFGAFVNLKVEDYYPSGKRLICWCMAQFG